MLSPMLSTTAQHQAAAAELHRRQRALVAASLIACPGAATKSTNPRWA
jgi:hypothetical protein